MKLYVIRHGETAWNKARKLQGHLGSDLNENGIAEARETARGMEHISFDFCITSPLVRARHTAEIILENRNIPIVEDERMMEIGFGLWEGRDIPSIFGSEDEENWRYFLENPYDYKPPKDGESIYDLLDRTGSLFQELIKSDAHREKTILISGHGCSCRAFLNKVYENQADFWQGGVPRNCAVSIVSVKDGTAFLEESDHLYYEYERLHTDSVSGQKYWKGNLHENK